ncbi:MerR family transcriptional regulator [Mesobacillus maritimus]|uniref:MerR family transcriptional regulator n=1 Tax=Mesobacillus maritimus TaxID=1643336 RepID=UPI002040EB88|nr:MerR family transcriptional regulator [Mesobacillus maritimus]MCM3672110.1 MerR family transcriptional regulator [Mesobacillus maritimus]
MNKNTWKIGELAKLTGLTVRTLHHYDQIGLFSASQVSDSGHRIYSESDIRKLQQILSFKQLGLSLEEIKEMLKKQSLDRVQVIKMQMQKVKKQIQLQEELYTRLENIYTLLDSEKDVSPNQLIQLIEVMNMVEHYFSKEQLDKMKNQTEQFSAEEMKQMESQWSTLIMDIRVEMEKNTPPADPKVTELAKTWKSLINQFSAGDQEIVKSAERFHSDNPNNPLQYGMDEALYQYINEAMAKI